DPDQVTIAGNSAGGISVCAHLTSPPVAGLFTGAVIQSGGCPSVPLTEAEATGVAFAEAAGCPDIGSISCLREQSTADFLGNDSWAWPVALVSGGRLLPEPPLSAVAGGNLQRVPLMIGGAHNEARFAVGGEFPMPVEEYVAWIHDTFGDAGASILELYP